MLETLNGQDERSKGIILVELYIKSMCKVRNITSVMNNYDTSVR